ncbi:MAG TPA: plastocyanin/azurin family copper-binding protein [Solirubrobacterales bacterium]|nr:plastocyanin/azurin family copper-binding protein [Solirubrobacterales bacterium]
MRKLVVVLALLALVPFAIAACGGDDDDGGDDAAPAEQPEEPAGDGEAGDGGGDGGGATVQVSSDPDGALAFEQSSLEAEAGSVTFEFENPAPVPHDFIVEDADENEIGGTDVITDDSASVTLDLEAGDYTFFCSVPGHREAGMEGPLTVQ